MQTIQSRLWSHARGLLHIGLPLVGSNIAFFAMHMTDSLMLGWYDLTALAAVTVAGSFFFVLTILGGGFGMAVSPLVAEAAERGDVTTGRRVTRMALWLSAGFFVAVAPIWWFTEDVMLMMGQEPHIAAAAQDYLRIAGFSMLPGLGVMVLKNFLSALEHTRIILTSTIGLAILNVPMNWLLIYGNFGFPEMGIRGAAVATVIASALSCLALLVYALRVFPSYDLLRRIWASDWEILRRVAALGTPIGLTSVAEGGLFSASAVMMGWIGEVPLAAHGIALQLSALSFMSHLGLSQALTVRAGQAFGRRDEGLLRETTWAALGLALVWVLVTVAAFLLIPEILIGAFLDPSDPDRDAVIAMGASLMVMAALFQLVDAGQVQMAAALRGLQDTRIPMWLAIGSYWLMGAPAAYLLAFPAGFGAMGLWAGLCIGLAAACVTLGWRFWGNAVRIAPHKTG